MIYKSAHPTGAILNIPSLKGSAERAAERRRRPPTPTMPLTLCLVPAWRQGPIHSHPVDWVLSPPRPRYELIPGLHEGVYR